MKSVFTLAVYPINLDLPPSLMKEIGRIMVQWSYLEWQLDHALCWLVPVDHKVGRLAITRGRVDSRMETMADLISYHRYDVDFDFAKLKKDISTAKHDRDQIAHGVWLRNLDTGRYVLAITSGKWPKNSNVPHRKRAVYPGGKEFTAKRAKEIRINVESLNDRTLVFRKALARALQSLIKITPGQPEPVDHLDTGNNPKEH